jgi:hypothetical protein
LRLFGAQGVESLELRCWGPSGFLAPTFQGGGSRRSFGHRVLSLRGRGVGVLRGSWCRGSRVEVSKALSSLWCLELHRVMVCTASMGHEVQRVLRSPKLRVSWTCGTSAAHRASTGKARKLEQVRSLGDEAARFRAVNTLEAGRRGQWLRLRGHRP